MTKQLKVNTVKLTTCVLCGATLNSDGSNIMLSKEKGMYVHRTCYFRFKPRRWDAKSTDGSKPKQSQKEPIAVNSIFVETDTGKVFIWTPKQQWEYEPRITYKPS